jgi:signal transduction histidine kinase
LVIDETPFRETPQLFLRRPFHFLGRQLRLTLSPAVTTTLVGGLLIVLKYASPSLRFSSDFTLIVALTCLLLVLVFIVINREVERMTLKRRLFLWSEMMSLPNPRLGSERTLGRVLEELKTFYEAEDCLLIDFPTRDSEYCIRRIASNERATTLQAEDLTDECARRLLVAPETHAFVLERGKLPFLGDQCTGYDVIAKESVRCIASDLNSLLVILDAEAVISVPFFKQNTAIARLFLTSNRKRAFSASDLKFLTELIGPILFLVENMRLVDTLANSARESERQRIALDIHDSVIQRYIGIDLALSAIRMKIQAGKTDIAADFEKLCLITQLEISGLRSYARQLSGVVQHDENFMAAVQRLTKEFTATTGIAVTLKGGQAPSINDRLAAEVFQMIAEGLSNIRRHTKASEATIEIETCGESFNLRIANNNSNGNGAPSKFVPKSITSRAASLGGAVDIELTPLGDTVLKIGIPI